jgi:PPK2 family polyphosphate:nucleotide phosphotransferase
MATRKKVSQKKSAKPAFSAERYRVRPRGFKLAQHSPEDRAGVPESKDERKAKMAALGERINALQDRFAAAAENGLLIVLQGIDTSGKDGTVRGVFSHMDPLGIRCQAFKAPTAEELSHDYLWRVHKVMPAKGEIVIFNRSHYEDVLVTRVRGWISAEECKRRYQQINDFERMLVETGTVILKFMLNISKDEQAIRLQERIDDPNKRWKFNAGDLDDRARWDDFHAAYQATLAATSTEHAPWYVVPGNSNTVRNLVVGHILAQTLELLDPHYPQPKEDLSQYTIV